MSSEKVEQDTTEHVDNPAAFANVVVLDEQLIVTEAEEKVGSIF